MNKKVPAFLYDLLKAKTYNFQNMDIGIIQKKKTIITGIMDVISCVNSHCYIINYKTNAEVDDLDTKYQNQLAAYVKAFKETTGNDANAMMYHIDV